MSIIADGTSSHLDGSTCGGSGCPAGSRRLPGTNTCIDLQTCVNGDKMEGKGLDIVNAFIDGDMSEVCKLLSDDENCNIPDMDEPITLVQEAYLDTDGIGFGQDIRLQITCCSDGIENCEDTGDPSGPSPCHTPSSPPDLICSTTGEGYVE